MMVQKMERLPAAIFRDRHLWRLRAANNREKYTPAAIFRDSFIVDKCEMMETGRIPLCDEGMIR